MLRAQKVLRVDHIWISLETLHFLVSMCVLTPPLCRLYSDHSSVCYVRQLTILSKDKGSELVDFYATSAAKD